MRNSGRDSMSALLSGKLRPEVGQHRCFRSRSVWFVLGNSTAGLFWAWSLNLCKRHKLNNHHHHLNLFLHPTSQGLCAMLCLRDKHREREADVVQCVL